MSDPSRPTSMGSPRAGVLAAIEACCPRLHRLLEQHASTTVSDYAALLWQTGLHEPAYAVAARRYVVAALRQHLETETPLNADERRDALEQFERVPVFQTSDHAQVVLDSGVFSTNLVYHLGAKRVGCRYLFVNACSTVTLETRAGIGPGWLTVRGSRVNVFGLSRAALGRRSVCAVSDPVRFRFTPPANALPPGEVAVLQELSALLGGSEYLSPARAFAAANAALWHALTRSDPTAIVYTDDALTASVTATYLDNDDTVLSRLLFDVRARARLEEVMASTLARGPGRLILRDTTQYFWGVRDGRIRPLRIDGSVLRERDNRARVVVPYTAKDVAGALRAGIVYPNLFVGFLALSILPRVRVLGGSSQLIYMPLISTICADAMAAIDPRWRELASDIRDVVVDGWIAGVVEDDVCPITALARCPRGRTVEERAERWRHIAVGRSVGTMSRFEYLRGLGTQTAGV